MMQNWDTTSVATDMQTAASNNFLEQNSWYNQMFAANIKAEPGIMSANTNVQNSRLSPPATHMESFLKQQQQQQQQLQFADSATMTPSPSNNGEFFDASSLHQQQMMHQQTYQQHFQQAQQAAAQNQVSTHLPLGFNPLTPPGLPNAVLPAMSHFYTQQQRQQQLTPSPQPMGSNLTEVSDKSALTPRHTPPMGITPPKSPKVINSTANSTTPSAMLIDEDQKDDDLISNSSEGLKYIPESEDDESIRMPIYNSHGKMKNYKCKTCGMIAITKMAFWEHARTHMKPEKVLQCPRCPFATELKHHLEYHIRKHKNLKPFQCDKCSYSCVNKSMLNSHRKSHSSVYQYRCAGCDYATKYCHSFKLHLRKYAHKPGLVLDEEGIPNPSVVIDVYGTRRGPKNKASSAAKKSSPDLKIPPTSQLSAALQGLPMNKKKQLPASTGRAKTPVVSEMPAFNFNTPMQNPQTQQSPPETAINQNHQQNQQQQSNSQMLSQMSPVMQHSPVNGQQTPQQQLNNLLPSLASFLQQNPNMAFFPYWNLNLQMIAVQQQAAVMAQLSPQLREQIQQQQQQQLQQLQQQQQQQQEHQQQQAENCDFVVEDEEDEEGNQEFDRKSIDSAMDLSQGTPSDVAMNLKLTTQHSATTPLYSSSSAGRRKGRVLKLDQEQLQHIINCSVSLSPQYLRQIQMPAKIDDPSSADESMEHGNHQTATASSSGNSSNSSSSTSNSSSSAAPSPINNITYQVFRQMYECRFCDIYFKDAVLYTIHMGYHSCDDVFKCNMCGEKCDGPVGLFVHMARNSHS